MFRNSFRKIDIKHEFLTPIPAQIMVYLGGGGGGGIGSCLLLGLISFQYFPLRRYMLAWVTRLAPCPPPRPPSLPVPRYATEPKRLQQPPNPALSLLSGLFREIWELGIILKFFFPKRSKSVTYLWRCSKNVTTNTPYGRTWTNIWTNMDAEHEILKMKVSCLRLLFPSLFTAFMAMSVPIINYSAKQTAFHFVTASDDAK